MFGIKPHLSIFVGALVLAGSTNSARASAVIAAVTANPGGSGGAVSGITVTSFNTAVNRTVGDVGNITSLQASSGTYNVIEMTVTFTELFSDFAINVNLLGQTLSDGPDAGDVLEYLLIMNVVNDMTVKNGSTASLNGIDMNIVSTGATDGIDDISFLVNNLSGTRTVGSAGGHLAGGSTGTAGTPLHAGALTDTQLRFGGFNGGGGGITAADTSSTVLAGVLTIGSEYLNSGSQFVGNFDITFTSNPEPGTMILGGVGLLIGGVGGYRRRRKAKAQTEQAA